MALKVLTAGLLAFSVMPAQARECKGVQFPDSVQLAGNTLRLNGLGLRKATIFKVSVYVAALYAPKPTNDPEQLMRSSVASELTLQFLRAVSASELGSRFAEGFAKSAAAQLPALNGRIAILKGWLTDIGPGQRLRFTHVPTQGVTVSINGEAKGTIPGDDFAAALLSIWLGAEPPNPELKTGLLGGPCD